MNKLRRFVYHKLLRRENTSYGCLAMSLASKDSFDASLNISRGSVFGNFLDIHIYDINDELFKTVKIPLSYKDASRIHEGIGTAFRISRNKIREENANARNNQNRQDQK